MAEFNLKKFLVDVFNPEPNETVLVMVDLPHDKYTDNDVWKERREMAEAWRQAFVDLSSERNFKVLSLLTYQSTGTHAAPLPKNGLLDGETVVLADLFPEVTLILALTEFSATAPLIGWAEKLPRFRGASMPKVSPSMQKTGLAADYEKIQKRCAEIRKYMERAESLNIEFSTGHTCFFDLRFRKPYVDDGMLHPSQWGKGGDSILNLPGGEVFEVPYEGEKGEASKTEGELPLDVEGERAIFVVKENRLVDVVGDGKLASHWREFVEVDPGRRNVSEVGFGCNKLADPMGPIIESEKSGFHWAFGESVHLGGTFGEDDFEDPANCCHEDFVYGGMNSVTVVKAELTEKDGTKVLIMEDGKYLI